MEASRAAFLRMSLGGAAGAVALALAACGSEEEEEPTGGEQEVRTARRDIAILNFALTLEHLEVEFYERVATSGVFRGEERELLRRIGVNEREHVDLLEQLIGQLAARPAGPPRTDFDEAIDGGRDGILETAAMVENLGAAAYLGQAPRIFDRDVLLGMLSIHSVEARHAATLNRLIGRPASPDGAFARPMAMEEVLEELEPFIRERA